MSALWDEFFSWENWIAAAREARRRKSKRADVAEFEAAREENLSDLRREIAEGTYRRGPYRTFEVHDPKTRLVAAPAYRDRVVDHALMGVLAPRWDRLLGPTMNFACRPGMGTHRAALYAQRLMRRRPWVLKLDVEKFYPSVPHDSLARVLRPHVPDARLMGVLEEVIRSYDSGRPGRGIAIGALTSQWFALLMMRPVLLAARQRGWPACAYLDDVLVWAATKQELREARRILMAEMERLGLRAHGGKRATHASERGLTFVGFRIFTSHLRVAGRSKVRARRKMRRRACDVREGRLSAERMSRAVASWVGHWKWASSFYLRRAALGEIVC